ncbi:hypothetical protein PoB_005292200 [Plakobranchus ocellatus]|uniref:Uncharacterized protein n=1 Tax=Plakobranchus ocellatus TaxID=259542 RepID=A0AAV4C571_9GAST|nr:hypothetical protein PoB_005292200 [Plakobranchus ocellatus]
MKYAVVFILSLLVILIARIDCKACLVDDELLPNGTLIECEYWAEPRVDTHTLTVYCCEEQGFRPHITTVKNRKQRTFYSSCECISTAGDYDDDEDDDDDDDDK